LKVGYKGEMQKRPYGLLQGVHPSEEELPFDSNVEGYMAEKKHTSNKRRIQQ
jgi:hypothetical protein